MVSRFKDRKGCNSICHYAEERVPRLVRAYISTCPTLFLTVKRGVQGRKLRVFERGGFCERGGEEVDRKPETRDYCVVYIVQDLPKWSVREEPYTESYGTREELENH